jgi:hypothetical protein
MVLAPVISVGMARVLVPVSSEPRGRILSIVVGAVLLVLALVGSASTWRTPAEWRDLHEAAEAVRSVVPADRLVVAPEALLFAADRRGCRLETTPRAARRASGEWGGRLDDPEDPLALVEFYRARGATFLADLRSGPSSGPDTPRARLRRAARHRYRVMIDRPEVFVVELVPDEARPRGSPHDLPK